MADRADHEERRDETSQLELSLPTGWGAKPLGELVDVLDSRRRPLNSSQRQQMKGPYPYYGANGVVDHVAEWIFDEPLLLMAEDGGYFDEFATRPIAYVINGRCWVNNHAHVLRVREPHLRDWVFHWMVHRDIRGFINSGTRSKLNQADMRRIPVALPPLAEQRKITAILSSVDETIGRTEAVIAQLDVVKKAMLEELLTRGIPGRHSRFKQTEIGEAPEAWQVVALVDICRPRQWPTISKEQLLPDGFPVFGANGLIGYYSEFNHQHPTIAITCRGATCGTVNVTPPRCYLTGNAMALDDVDDKRIAFSFLHQALVHRGLGDSITGSAQPQITRQSLGVVRLPLPSVFEQREIGELLGSIDARRAAESAVLRELREVKGGVSSSLLSGEVRVSVGEGHT